MPGLREASPTRRIFYDDVTARGAAICDYMPLRAGVALLSGEEFYLPGEMA